MTCPADLHTHTTASDGQYTPSQLAAKALAAGIQILAVTDHDTMDGAEEAVRAGQACGLTVLRGVELGAREDRHMHILGLNLGPECPALAELCRRLRASREERKYRIAAFLRGKGLDVPLEEVEALAGGGVVARPHFARVMLRRGYVSSSGRPSTAIWTRTNTSALSGGRPAPRNASRPSMTRVERRFWPIPASSAAPTGAWRKSSVH